MPRDAIALHGWKATPTENGDGYWIYSPTGKFEGYARNESVAHKWIEESSGFNNSLLKTIEKKDLICVRGEEIDIYEFPHKGWYRIDLYKVNGKEIGRVQTKNIRNRMDVMTISDNDSCGAVIDEDIEWMLRMTGYRLV